MDRDWKDIKKEILSNPEVKAEYEQLAIEYQIASQFIKARQEVKITQEEFAEKVGTKQESISRFESGNDNPTIEKLQKYAKALGKELEIRLV
jgi:DNA-binding XRE family transcriptional regulator